MVEEEQKEEVIIPDQETFVEPVQSVDLIAQAEDAVKRLEAANLKTAELLTRQEQLMVERTLGGVALAAVPPKSDEILAKERAKMFLAGTGLEDDF